MAEFLAQEPLSEHPTNQIADGSMDHPKNHPLTVALILAGGSSSRFSCCGQDKLLLPLTLPDSPSQSGKREKEKSSKAEKQEKPLLLVTLKAFLEAKTIDQIILVVAAEKKAAYQALIAEFLATFANPKPVTFTLGGKSRYESTQSGISLLSQIALDHHATFVAIHDGARPLITPALIDEVVTHAYRKGAAALAHPVTDTLHRVNAEQEAIETIPRENLWAMETPQVFRLDLWLKARQYHQCYILEGKKTAVTDDISLLLAAGFTVELFKNPTFNPKVTFPQDKIFFS